MKVAAIAAFFAALAGVLVLAFQPFQSSPSGSSASRTIYSFAYALGHHNFGRACSYLSDAKRGPAGACDEGLTYNAGINMLMFGADVFKGMKVVPGSAHENANGSVTYKLRSEQMPPTKVTVAKQKASGKWRVVKLG